MSRSPGSELVVAEGWVVDELAAARLRVQLERAPADVVGIAASPGPLDPGESFVNRAARSARTPLDSLAPASAHAVEGAVVLRAGVGHQVEDDRIEVDPGAGAVLVDRGVHVHDPWQPVDPLAPVGPDVRPPFPHRAVVLLLGVDADLDVTDWARGLANDLLRHGVDARMAVTEATEGLHLTRPCRTAPEVLAAVGPHVVIPLDDAAHDALEGWWGDDRSTLVVAYEPDALVGAEPVSWRLGAARGRLRGRVGQAARGADLARLVDRLCGGPHPLPPDDHPADDLAAAIQGGVGAVVSSIRSRRSAPDERRRRSIRIVHAGGPVEPWLDGLLDALDLAGHDVQRRSVTAGGARDVDARDVLLLQGVPATDGLLAAIATRRADGRPTVVAAGPGGSPPGSPALHGDVERLVRASGQVVTPAPGVARAVDDEVAEHLVIPPLLGSHRLAELRSLRARPAELVDGPGTIGWQLDPASPDHEVAAIARALAVVLGEQPETELVLVAPAGTGTAPSELVRRAEVLDDRPGAWVVNRWTAQIWTTSAEVYERTGDVTPLVETSALAVPTLLPGGHPALRAVPHPRPLRVRPSSEPEPWAKALRPLVRDLGARTRRAVEAVAVVDALFGPASSAAVADRFLGWVDAFAATVAVGEVARA